MHDQRMIGRPPFDRVDAPNRNDIRCVGRQTVDRLGGKRDDAAGG
jgi:hypothetical protein